MIKRTERPTLTCQTCYNPTPHILADVEEIALACGGPEGFRCVKHLVQGDRHRLTPLPYVKCNATDVGLGVHYRCTKCATRRLWGFEGGNPDPPERDWSGGTFGEVLDKHALECEDDPL